MNINEDKVFLTFQLGGKHLVSPGKYQEARISKGKTMTYSCGIIGPACIIDTPMKTIQAPKYHYATQSITLGKEFLAHALERPKPPRHGFERWLRQPLGKLYQEWTKLKPEQRLAKFIEIYVSDVTGMQNPIFDYEIV